MGGKEELGGGRGWQGKVKCNKGVGMGNGRGMVWEVCMWGEGRGREGQSFEWNGWTGM